MSKKKPGNYIVRWSPNGDAGGDHITNATSIRITKQQQKNGKEICVRKSVKTFFGNKIL